MPVALSIDNLNAVAKKLENALRVVRAATLATTGGTEPASLNREIPAITSAISGAASVTAAAQAVVALV